MTAHVRRMTVADAGAWERMRQALWPSEPGEHAHEIAAFLQGTGAEGMDAFVALDDDGAAIGFAEAGIRAYAEGCHSGRVAYLEGLFVEEPHRGRGVARALVRAVEDWGRTQGCTELASDTEFTNARSAAMHRALGFDEVERIICFRKEL